MFTALKVENFKSIPTLEAELGRVTVLIGENGCGKSNILEAVAFAAAAANNKLDHEFLASRGIRITDPKFMFAAFEETAAKKITIELQGCGNPPYQIKFIAPDDVTGFSPSERWTHQQNISLSEGELTGLRNAAEASSDHFEDVIRRFLNEKEGPPWDFLVYSPENSALRTFQSEGQILPLGIRGEGLFALLKALGANEKGRSVLTEISGELALIDWFKEFRAPANAAPGERTLLIGDRYLGESSLFDQRSANEGFLFLLFYFALLVSPGTPAFFAIDNVDASLNPKLCAELTRRIVKLAKRHDKQVILTTHNPAVLDGLDLGDDEQRLLVVHRNKHGHTKTRRVHKPEPVEGAAPVRLSEAFLRGYIGGLPKNF